MEYLRKIIGFVKTGLFLPLFALIALLWPAAGAHGATIKAASVSFQDVSTAVAQAKSGDTVIIPAGNSNWGSSTLSIQKAITLQGQGTGSGGTKISNITTQGTIQLSMNDTVNLMRITGVYFDMGTFDGSTYKRAIHGNAVLNNLRIDHCYFQAGTLAINLENGPCYGVVDHCTFHNGCNDIYLQNTTSSDGANPGNQSWTTPIHPGGTDTMVVEDCSFVFDVNTNWNGSILYGQQGDRLCVRHCTFDYSASPCPISVGDPHGFAPASNSGGWGCSTRFWEFYNNTIKAQYTYRFFSNRGGTYICHDNNWSGQNIPGSPYELTVETVTYPNGGHATSELTVGYFYNETVNGSIASKAAYSTGITGAPVENRDFLNRAPQSGDSLNDGTSNSPYHFYGYKPLVYPHPLVTGQNGSTNPTGISTPTDLHVVP
jgi:hypothetical protein